MSPIQSPNNTTPYPIQDNQNGKAQEPEHPGVPMHDPAITHASTLPDFDWNQFGSPLLDTPALTSEYADVSGDHGPYQHPNGPYTSPTSPCAGEHDFPSLGLQDNFSVETLFGMHAANAGQQEPTITRYLDPSQTQMHCQPGSGINPSLLQAQNKAFQPHQSQPMSGMTATSPGFEPTNNTNGSNHNFRDHNHFIGSSSSAPSPITSRQNFASDHAITTPVEAKVPPHEPTTMSDMDMELPTAAAAVEAASPNANSNSNSNIWRNEYDDLIRRFKYKKRTVKQIVTALRNKFGIDKTANAVSKRWTTIKKMDSKDESKAVLQNVMPPFVRLFNDALANLPRGTSTSARRQGHHHHHHQGHINDIMDPQLSAIMLHEDTQHGNEKVLEHFGKGLKKLVEECVLMSQRRGGSRE